MDFIRRYWGQVTEELGRSKYYILAAAIIFGFGIYSGFSSTDLDEMLAQMTQQVFGEIQEEISESDNPTQTSILLIFLNNVRAVFFMMILGIGIGLFPAFSMLLNGILVGFVLRIQQSAGLPLDELILKGLLPHGLFELPAIFIAAGYGLRLGITLVRRLFPSQRSIVQDIRSILKSGIPLFGFLVVLLLVASIIESTLTAWLLLG